MRAGRANALTALGLLALLLVVVLAAPRWTRLLTRTVPGEESAEESGAAAPAAEPEGPAEKLEKRADRKFPIRLRARKQPSKTVASFQPLPDDPLVRRGAGPLAGGMVERYEGGGGGATGGALLNGGGCAAAIG